MFKKIVGASSSSNTPIIRANDALARTAEIKKTDELEPKDLGEYDRLYKVAVDNIAMEINASLIDKRYSAALTLTQQILFDIYSDEFTWCNATSVRHDLEVSAELVTHLRRWLTLLALFPEGTIKLDQLEADLKKLTIINYKTFFYLFFFIKTSSINNDVPFIYRAVAKILNNIMPHYLKSQLQLIEDSPMVIDYIAMELTRLTKKNNDCSWKHDSIITCLQQYFIVLTRLLEVGLNDHEICKLFYKDHLDILHSIKIKADTLNSYIVKLVLELDNNAIDWDLCESFIITLSLYEQASQISKSSSSFVRYVAKEINALLALYRRFSPKHLKAFLALEQCWESLDREYNQNYRDFLSASRGKNSNHKMSVVINNRWVLIEKLHNLENELNSLALKIQESKMRIASDYELLGKIFYRLKYIAKRYLEMKRQSHNTTFFSNHNSSLVELRVNYCMQESNYLRKSFFIFYEKNNFDEAYESSKKNIELLHILNDRCTEESITRQLESIFDHLYLLETYCGKKLSANQLNEEMVHLTTRLLFLFGRCNNDSLKQHFLDFFRIDDFSFFKRLINIFHLHKSSLDYYLNSLYYLTCHLLWNSDDFSIIFLNIARRNSLPGDVLQEIKVKILQLFLNNCNSKVSEWVTDNATARSKTIYYQPIKTSITETLQQYSKNLLSGACNQLPQLCWPKKLAFFEFSDPSILTLKNKITVQLSILETILTGSIVLSKFQPNELETLKHLAKHKLVGKDKTKQVFLNKLKTLKKDNCTNIFFTTTEVEIIQNLFNMNGHQHLCQKLVLRSLNSLINDNQCQKVAASSSSSSSICSGF